jgi:chromosome condensin MukBEF ATPase and DNA-binding subunit MukB
MTDQKTHDERRAAQIQAVRDVMGWGEQPDAWNERNVAELAAELVDAVHAAGRDGQGDVDQLRAEVADYRRLFDIQQTRMERATARWQAAHQRANVMPDLAALLDWLMAQADQGEAEATETAEPRG